jgi:DNA-binding HxlR family transcriptional regulator
LQQEGLVEHHQDAEAADYRLTAAGVELVDLLGEILRWKREHRTDDDDDDDR